MCWDPLARLSVVSPTMTHSSCPAPSNTGPTPLVDFFQLCYIKDISGTWCDMASSIQDGYTALIWASAYGHVECVKVLLDKGAQTNLQNKVSTVPDQTNVCC